jgi:hypothetical protein
MKKLITGKLKLKYEELHNQLNEIKAKLDLVQLSTARIESRQLKTLQPVKSIQDYEYRVYSQFGEDGIIQMLIDQVRPKEKVFVEFGVEDYAESNTRFLLKNNNWSGLVIDGSDENIRKIRKSNYYWKHNLKAVEAFIDRDNINKILSDNGVSGNIGLLSIDIDGNDYWVWEKINVIDPDIVIVEYNSRFGSEKAVTIPYSKDFIRSKAHYSMIYFGASLAALCYLAQKKGYDFVGCSSSGVNSFFVKRTVRPTTLPVITPMKGFVENQVREARNEEGEMAYLSREEERKVLEGLPLVDVRKA